MKQLFASTLVGAGLLHAVSVSAVPILTLQERQGQFIDWTWSDGSGSGTFVATSPTSGAWFALDFPLPSSISENFYGEWEEDSPNQRNHVFITPKLDPSNAPIPNVGLFYANSDWPDFNGGLAPLGTALDSDHGLYQVIFLDGPDHVLFVSDMGGSGWLLAGSLGAMTLIRRRPAA
jgi:hypothetical protein